MPPRLRILASIALGFATFLTANECAADWTKTIECPEGRVYRDVRRDAGREEFCERELPGSLVVKDGPSRAWFSEGYLAEQGSYKDGRKIGMWKECDRFDRCSERNYEAVLPMERVAGISPKIPLAYVDGKYVFDFGACWATWVTQLDQEQPKLSLNIGRGVIRCEVTHIPAASARLPFPRDDYYLCEVPFTVGVRQFDTLDLRQEFGKVGLPQFCRHDGPTSDQDFAIRLWVNAPFIAYSSNREVRAWTLAATMVDVECAALENSGTESEAVVIRLNPFAERLVLDHLGKDDMRADACSQPAPLGSMETIRTEGGRVLFRFPLGASASVRSRQKACIIAQSPPQNSCVPK